MGNQRRALTAVYRFLLRLYGPAFRETFGEEMTAVFEERLLEASSEGWPVRTAVLARELLGLLAGGMRQRLYARQASPALAGGGIAWPDTDGRLWRRVKQLLVYALAFYAFFLLLQACRAAWFVTFDETFDVRHVALGDVNGDGRLDAFLSLGSVGDGYWRADRLLLNQGDGVFLDSGQELGEWRSFAGVIADLSGDGHADIISSSYVGLMVYQNAGDGDFKTINYMPSNIGTGRAGYLNVDVADLNGDGRQDLFLGACCGWKGHNPPPVMYPYGEVWLNNGEGRVASNGQQIGQFGANAVALGDLNGDGTVDAFLANGKTIRETPVQISDNSIFRTMLASVGLLTASDGYYNYKTPNTVWFNDGQGTFYDSEQRLGRAESMDVALSDLDGDGAPDAVVGNHGPDEIWLNDGAGNFARARQRLGRGMTWSVSLHDFDGDGDLDLLAGGETSARVWLNDGTGRFRAGQRVRYGRYESIAAGDLDGDGVVDLIAAGTETYRVWWGLGDGRFEGGVLKYHR